MNTTDGRNVELIFSSSKMRKQFLLKLLELKWIHQDDVPTSEQSCVCYKPFFKNQSNKYIISKN